MVRLVIVDNGGLTWVAKSQGATKGLRYDPDMGTNARLSCTATGHALMLTMSDEEAIALVSKQGFGTPKDYGPNAPTMIKALRAYLQVARERGYAMINEVFARGMTAMAAPVKRPNQPAIGVISIVGPLSRLTERKMRELGKPLLEAANELAATSNASLLFTTWRAQQAARGYERGAGLSAASASCQARSSSACTCCASATRSCAAMARCRP